MAAQARIISLLMDPKHNAVRSTHLPMRAISIMVYRASKRLIYAMSRRKSASFQACSFPRYALLGQIAMWDV